MNLTKKFSRKYRANSEPKTIVWVLVGLQRELDTICDENDISLEKTMFGLFAFSYDYYEWTSLVCVSEDPQKLKDYWKSEGDGIPFANDEKEHRSFAKNEEAHYKIQPIKCV